MSDSLQQKTREKEDLQEQLEGVQDKMNNLQDQLSQVREYPRLEKMQNLPVILSKFALKKWIFYKFLEIFERKRQKIHLNVIFPLKIANISL